MRILRSLLLAGLVAATAAQAQERDLFEEAPWYVGFGLNYIHFEGDEPVNPGVGPGIKLGYDMNEFFGMEVGVNYYPKLDNSDFGPDSDRFQLDDAIYAASLQLDALLHLRNSKNLRWDPYVSIGGNLMYYEEDLGDDSNPEIVLAAGAGLFYHFNDTWSARADYRTAVAGADTEFNQIIFVGANYRWGAAVKPVYSVSGGDLDSDGDGLVDSREAEIGTDPYDPDTDKDGLSDGEEVLTHNTDPLNPDSDWDALKDGPEILTYKTNPLDRDTDDGGVADGHEVIEDKTDPLNGADDLQLFTLNIEFDYDKAVLRSDDYDELDVIVKVLQRDPGATARIEGHADKRKTSKRDYNIRLSERRAKAVEDYLVTIGGIDRSRLTHKGYGFDRPLVLNDTEANMQKNRRTEIYIRPTGSTDSTEATSGEAIDPDAALPVDGAPAAVAAPAPVVDDGGGSAGTRKDK